MNLTKEQQLLALMMCDIHEALQINPNHASVNPDLVRKAISSGHQWALEWEYEGQIIPIESTQQNVLTFVVDVLDMYEFIEESFNALSGDEQTDVLEQAGVPSAHFLGFDGNNESSYRSVAQFLVHEMNRFESLADRAGNNSHMPTLDRYQAQLDVFLPLRNNVQVPLSKGNLIRVIGAR